MLTFKQMEQIAADVRETLFDFAINNVDAPDDIKLPLIWFMESYSLGRYETLLKMWEDGLESMRGQCLLTRCSQITADAKYDRAQTHLKNKRYSEVVDMMITNDWDYVVYSGDIIEMFYNHKTGKTDYILNLGTVNFQEVFPSNC